LSSKIASQLSIDVPGEHFKRHGLKECVHLVRSIEAAPPGEHRDAGEASRCRTRSDRSQSVILIARAHVFESIRDKNDDKINALLAEVSYLELFQLLASLVRR
jgi:hypothetical protein